MKTLESDKFIEWLKDFNSKVLCKNVSNMWRPSKEEPNAEEIRERTDAERSTDGEPHE